MKNSKTPNTYYSLIVKCGDETTFLAQNRMHTLLTKAIFLHILGCPRWSHWTMGYQSGTGGNVSFTKKKHQYKNEKIQTTISHTPKKYFEHISFCANVLIRPFHLICNYIIYDGKHKSEVLRIISVKYVSCKRPYSKVEHILKISFF